MSPVVFVIFSFFHYFFFFFPEGGIAPCLSVCGKERKSIA